MLTAVLMAGGLNPIVVGMEGFWLAAAIADVMLKLTGNLNCDMAPNAPPRKGKPAIGARCFAAAAILAFSRSFSRSRSLATSSTRRSKRMPLKG